MDHEIFYTGQVKDGKIVGIPRKRINEELAYFEGKHIEVVIRKRKRQRTTQQNRLYWLYVEIIGEQLGYSKDECSEILKFKFLKTESVNEQTGECFEYIRGTSSLSTVEFLEFIENISQWVAQAFGIVLPAPDEQIKAKLDS